MKKDQAENLTHNFWEHAFKNHEYMWGDKPALSAILAKDIFLANNAKSVLIPGIGYGRNAQPFLDQNMFVTGIELSERAIQLANEKYPHRISIHNGSVADMPFDGNVYDGIFCYALIHLLDKEHRTKLLKDCYAQLKKNGTMIFTTISKQAHTYRQGIEIEKDRFRMYGGVDMFFYDEESIVAEFSNYGLIAVQQVDENYPFHFIICQKT